MTVTKKVENTYYTKDFHAVRSGPTFQITGTGSHHVYARVDPQDGTVVWPITQVAKGDRAQIYRLISEVLENET